MRHAFSPPTHEPHSERPVHGSLHGPPVHGHGLHLLFNILQHRRGGAHEADINLNAIYQWKENHHTKVSNLASRTLQGISNFVFGWIDRSIPDGRDINIDRSARKFPKRESV